MRLPDPRAARAPAVAGLFYPATRGEVERTVRACLEGAAELAARPAPKALIAPHAGYVYSGPIAGSAFAAVAPGVRRVVLLGPAHRAPLAGLALPEAGRLETPLGSVAVDLELAAAVAALPQVAVDDRPHAGEHSLEVELPFLQTILGEFTLLPLVVGAAEPEAVAEVLEAAWNGDETLIVVSSDLSHYHPYERARRIDERTAEAICALAGPIPTERACGAHAVNGLLVAARRRGLAAELLDLRNSGDTAGDRRQVVGYGAFHFTARADEAGVGG